MGAVNGASQAAASFVRAVGPALGGAMWGLSVSLPFQGHQLLPFALTAAGFAAPLCILTFVNLASLNDSDGKRAEKPLPSRTESGELSP